MKTISNRKLARVITASVHCTGGYMYGSATIIGEVRGLVQEIRSTRWEECYHPTQKDIAANKAALFRAPLGAWVGIEGNGQEYRQEYRSEEVWVKVGPCSWEKRTDYEERWGDWGESTEDHLTGEYRYEWRDF